MTNEQANAVYDLLVANLAATENWRDDFVYHARRDRDLEYRFQGCLGFGGKLYRDHAGLRVGCYPKDRNASRDALITEANARLAGMTLEEVR